MIAADGLHYALDLNKSNQGWYKRILESSLIRVSGYSGVIISKKVGQISCKREEKADESKKKTSKTFYLNFESKQDSCENILELGIQKINGRQAKKVKVDRQTSIYITQSNIYCIPVVRISLRFPVALISTRPYDTHCAWFCEIIEKS